MSMVNRRNFLLGAAAIGAGGIAYTTMRGSSSLSRSDIEARKPLMMPPLLDSTKTGSFTVTAQSGTTSFMGSSQANTIGFNQSYLGPVVRMQKGALRPMVQNTLGWPISAHWHGLLVPGEHDGGPHLPIMTDQAWNPDMQIAQEPCTAFFHTHIHERTARDVYSGLAGIIHVVDGRDEERGLPADFGVDDLTLVLQDRRFSPEGELQYANSMMDIMHGMTGDTVLINGQIDPVAIVPKAVVRLRLVNASNARIYELFCDDSRPMYLIATDGGYLPSPNPITRLRLSPGERAELLVDFSNGIGMTLASSGDPNEGMGGMMGRTRGLMENMIGARQFSVIPFVVDERIERKILSIPDDLGGALPALQTGQVETERSLSLDMGMGGGMMGRGMMGQFAINGRAFDMERIDARIKLGSVEKWLVSTDMLAHPFHVHGVSFQVLRENGNEPRPENRGWKDTILVDGQTELLVYFGQPAAEQNPFMYHCHILEHEDGGMMGQFTVA